MRKRREKRQVRKEKGKKKAEKGRTHQRVGAEEEGEGAEGSSLLPFTVGERRLFVVVVCVCSSRSAYYFHYNISFLSFFLFVFWQRSSFFLSMPTAKAHLRVHRSRGKEVNGGAAATTTTATTKVCTHWPFCLFVAFLALADSVYRSSYLVAGFLAFTLFAFFFLLLFLCKNELACVGEVKLIYLRIAVVLLVLRAEVGWCFFLGVEGRRDGVFSRAHGGVDASRFLFFFFSWCVFVCVYGRGTGTALRNIPRIRSVSVYAFRSFIPSFRFRCV
jgi:hypothetical protein